MRVVQILAGRNDADTKERRKHNPQRRVAVYQTRVTNRLHQPNHQQP